MYEIKLKRIYEPASAQDGYRILVDRLWPRGVTRARAKVDCWMRGVTPTPALRKWFGHEPAKWTEFKRRYLQELRDNRDAVNELIELVKTHRRVTLLYAARDEEHTHALVLAAHLQRRLRKQPSST